MLVAVFTTLSQGVIKQATAGTNLFALSVTNGQESLNDKLQKGVSIQHNTLN